MEFSELGDHCEYLGCLLLDFLPFQCSGCKKTFCLEHRSFSGHKCDHTSTIQVPECPLCQQLIPLKKGEDPNTKVDEHISKGCPKEDSEKMKTNFCSHKKCKNAELIPILCPNCRKNYCLKHRHAADHECEQMNDSRSEKMASVAEKRAANLETKKMIQQRIDLLIKEQTEKKPTAKKVQMMKMKTKSLGANNIPEEKRFYLEVLFPMSSGGQPKLMFFNSSWSIGKVLDVVADAGRIENRNNQANAEKLVLVSLKSGQPLENSISLKDYSDSKLLESGDSILLETLGGLIEY